jgi:RNA polymerase sigma factor (sigma-70 family)
MTENHATQFLKSIDPGVEFKIAVLTAEHRIQFYRNDSECNLGGYTAEDVVQDVFLKLLKNQNLLRPEDLTVGGYRKRVRGMINNVIYSLTQRKEIQMTLSYDPTDTMLDEVFFDCISAESAWAEKSAAKREENTALLDEVANELLPDEDAWLVLSELRDGKQPQEISTGNQIPIEKVRNLVKRVKRAIKAKIPIRS